MPKILLVEDDKDLAFMIEDWLKSERYSLDISHDGEEGYEFAIRGSYDLIILDWDLPGMNGIDFTRKIRSSGAKVPILMLTGKSTIDDKEVGLDSGADDYLSKPFHMRELSARLRALARRPDTKVTTTLKVGALELDYNSHKVYNDGSAVHLTPKEFALLELLMRNPGEMFTTEALLIRVWSFETDAGADAVRTVVRRLRQKLDGGADEADSIIENHRKIGYRLRAPR